MYFHMHYSPVKDVVVVNDRWGAGIPGKHGGFFTYADRFDPGTMFNSNGLKCF